MANHQPNACILGLLGLGEMGGPIARKLMEAGYSLIGFDPVPSRLDACVQAGIRAAGSEGEVVRQADIVLTSLPSSEAFVEMAEKHLIPLSRKGQIFIDLGTVAPPETRRLAADFAAKGALLLDAPVSGGPQGAEAGSLRVFVGGDEPVMEECRPILEALGNPAYIVYCGPSGSGQVVKGVNQLAMGLGAAAYLEAVAFGMRAGVDAETIRAAVGESGGAGDWRAFIEFVAARAAAGEAQKIGVKFREMPYFLREAEEQHFELPLTQTLYAFCDAGERVVVDDHRTAPSFWHELMASAGEPEEIEEEAAEEPEMTLARVTSTMLYAIGYDEASQDLEVVFNTGGIYRYRVVPKDVYEGLLSARSKGNYMHDHVLGMFPYERLGRFRKRRR
ncbi:MAG: KTSC domain-containing protein [Armatimonadetes bacterium]|nr:KTSC domain-containing protein [Armatimonadota bacterium]